MTTAYAWGFADALVTRLGNLPGVDVRRLQAVLNVPVEATAAETASRLGVRFLSTARFKSQKGYGDSRWKC